MRRAACSWLLPACMLLFIRTLHAHVDAQYLQIDPHLRTHAGQQYQQYAYTSSQPAYIGLGAAAQAAFKEADHITGVLLDNTGAATAAITHPAADPTPALKRHRRVKHGRHAHKRAKAMYDGSGYDQDLISYEEAVFDIPSESTHSHHHRSRGDSKSSSSSYQGAAPLGGGGGARHSKELQRGDDDDEGSFFHKQTMGHDSSSSSSTSNSGKSQGASQSSSGSHTTGSAGKSSPSGGPSSNSDVKSGVCKQVLLEEKEVEVVFSATKDKATITTLLGTCANPTHPLPTLGGGCVVECEHLEDLIMVTSLNTHAFIAPANFKAVDNYYPVMCSYRADGPLKGSCNIVMKVACCSDVTRPDKSESKYKAMIQHKVPDYESAADDGDDDDEYYAIVKSKLLRIPLPSKKYSA